LVGEDFWIGRKRTAEAEERVRTLDWRAVFPEIWPAGRDGGFDIVLGNPPYVKLQNLMKVDPDVAAYLAAARGDDAYASAQTGNFDLYLPFIEKGLRLLAPGGRMAFIAPSLWTVNQYGEGLRRVMRRDRHLERWLDFKAHQVFEDVITYTALQFYTYGLQEAVRIAVAPSGEMADVDWSDADLAVPYESLPEDGEWLMATGPERALIERLARACLRLDDPVLTTDIFQGVKTGADQVFKLQRLGVDRYLCRPDREAEYEVEIEDELMHPILSGPETKRYIHPSSDIYLLFPYSKSGNTVRLMSGDILQGKFPKAWRHLNNWKSVLERRDGGALKDEGWYRFSRSQSLERAGTRKLCAAGTVPSLRFSFDENGSFFLTGGRVDGVVPSRSIDPWFCLGVVNGPVCDFVFRRIGRVKQGGYYEPTSSSSRPCRFQTPRWRRALTSRAARGGCKRDGRTAAIFCKKPPIASPCWRGRATRRAGFGPSCRPCQR
jgi:hypothetical protein